MLPSAAAYILPKVAGPKWLGQSGWPKVAGPQVERPAARGTQVYILPLPVSKLEKHYA